MMIYELVRRLCGVLLQIKKVVLGGRVPKWSSLRGGSCCNKTPKSPRAC